MKYTLTLLLVLALHFYGISQTTLVFSQCLTFAGDGPWTAPIENSSARISQQFTVPAGKVWKLEYASVQSSSGYLRVNGFTVSALNSAVTTFPLWLKSGDIIEFYTSSYPPSYDSDFFLSILEFNN